MTLSPDALHFVPLGGCGEIGMNLNLYACRGKWLMVDLGVTFGDERTPGADLIMADPRFIEERSRDLLGIVLTHAHEDHLGAVAHLWPRLRAPVYATPFTAAVLRAKLREVGLADEVPLREIPLSGSFELGPFGLRYLTVTHSIPEPNALALTTPFGTVLHTGDWKLDPEPLVGGRVDRSAFKALGDDGVLALVCDSTNVFAPGTSGSEAAVRVSLAQLVAGCAGRVFVTLFASNIARLESVVEAARSNRRAVAALGRSLARYMEAAQAAGYLRDLEPFLSEEEAQRLPAERVLYALTGCQGEPNAALSRIVDGGHPFLRFGPGDTVIFSSKIIPGNERAIGRVHNALVRQGVRVLSERDHFVHVSGHPNRDELAEMYRWIRPRIAVPVHGETRHLAEHGELAASFQVPDVKVIENGEVLRLAPGPAEVVDRVPTGRLLLDGTALIEGESPLFKTRRRMLYHGVVLLTLVLDDRGRLLAPPRLSAPGLGNGGADLEQAIGAVEDALESLTRAERVDDKAVHEAARLALRRHYAARTGKRPLIEVQVVRA